MLEGLILPWEIEECCLEEKDKADPLVVLVVTLVIITTLGRGNAWMCVVYALLADHGMRDRVRGMDPAVGVL